MNDLNRKLVEQIDEYVEKNTLPMNQTNSAKIAEPEILRLANENNIDPADLLVDYLDHVALVSKKINQDGDEKIFSESEVLGDTFKLY